MKKLAIVVCLLALASLATAQGYEKGKTTIGPLLGMGPNGLAIGAQGEYGAMDKFGFGGIVSYSSKTDDYFYGKMTVTYITVGGQGNYHFKPGAKFDPFLGAILGYDIASASWDWAPGYTSYYGASAAASALVIGLSIGGNYYFNKTSAAAIRVGYPMYLAGGVNFIF